MILFVILHLRCINFINLFLWHIAKVENFSFWEHCWKLFYSRSPFFCSSHVDYTLRVFSHVCKYPWFCFGDCLFVLYEVSYFDFWPIVKIENFKSIFHCCKSLFFSLFLILLNTQFFYFPRYFNLFVSYCCFLLIFFFCWAEEWGCGYWFCFFLKFFQFMFLVFVDR